MKLAQFSLISTILFSSFASAHNIWLESISGNQYAIKFGHETTEPYPLSKLTHVQQIDAQGKRSDLSPYFQKTAGEKGEASVQIANGDMVFLEFNNGVWSKLPSGKYVEKTKKEAPTAEFSINPMKLGKAILNWGEQAFKPHDQAYELVPLAKPEAGKPMQILVLHHGKPVEGIKVGLGEDQPFNLSNAQGIATFTPTQGFNKVWAEFEEKVAGNPDYSDRSYEYMLTFDVP
ncbi:MAG: DUF4198 domain-containing protein [Haemophilus parahaemolyticus]|uniref:DUF4198 domain-containing protein n=1 Tax=Haemophilus parahaemolyticus TaxID=735 RepID=UPI0026F2EE97|nr:DUF4198 domain-containing protein [Haemophilus parahaemolyticus]MBS6009002.1 DUF4198 domain-containing protein [Haemophilus parahaemolyticus]